MGKYRKKPVKVIEAFQMTKEHRLDNSEWPNWLNVARQKDVVEQGSVFCASDGSLDAETHTRLFIQTLRGTERIVWGDWIVRGTDGYLSLWKPGIFEEAYEMVEE